MPHAELHPASHVEHDTVRDRLGNEHRLTITIYANAKKTHDVLGERWRWIWIGVDAKDVTSGSRGAGPTHTMDAHLAGEVARESARRFYKAYPKT